MFICDKNMNCVECNYNYADSIDDINSEVRDCPYLVEVKKVNNSKIADIIVKENETGYSAILDYILRYNQHTHNCGSVIVHLGTSYDGINYWYSNEIVYEENGCYMFYNDWWEGEKYIKLVGVQAIDDMVITDGIFEK